MLQTDQEWPSVSSQTKGLLVNADGSVDVYFGPGPARQREELDADHPRQGLEHLLRLYGPLEPFQEKPLAAED